MLSLSNSERQLILEYRSRVAAAKAKRSTTSKAVLSASSDTVRNSTEVVVAADGVYLRDRRDNSFRRVRNNPGRTTEDVRDEASDVEASFGDAATAAADVHGSNPPRDSVQHDALQSTNGTESFVIDGKGAESGGPENNGNNPAKKIYDDQARQRSVDPVDDVGGLYNSYLRESINSSMCGPPDVLVEGNDDFLKTPAAASKQVRRSKILGTSTDRWAPENLGQHSMNKSASSSKSVSTAVPATSHTGSKVTSEVDLGGPTFDAESQSAEAAAFSRLMAAAPRQAQTLEQNIRPQPRLFNMPECTSSVSYDKGPSVPQGGQQDATTSSMRRRHEVAHRDAGVSPTTSFAYSRPLSAASSRIMKERSSIGGTSGDAFRDDLSYSFRGPRPPAERPSPLMRCTSTPMLPFVDEAALQDLRRYKSERVLLPNYVGEPETLMMDHDWRTQSGPDNVGLSLHYRSSGQYYEQNVNRSASFGDGDHLRTIRSTTSNTARFCSPHRHAIPRTTLAPEVATPQGSRLYEDYGRDAFTLQQVHDMAPHGIIFNNRIQQYHPSRDNMQPIKTNRIHDNAGCVSRLDSQNRRRGLVDRLPPWKMVQYQPLPRQPFAGSYSYLGPRGQIFRREPTPPRKGSLRSGQSRATSLDSQYRRPAWRSTSRNAPPPQSLSSRPGSRSAFRLGPRDGAQDFRFHDERSLGRFRRDHQRQHYAGHLHTLTRDNYSDHTGATYTYGPRGPFTASDFAAFYPASRSRLTSRPLDHPFYDRDTVKVREFMPTTTMPRDSAYTDQDLALLIARGQSQERFLSRYGN
ncbi:unnamed protein product [Amoebophrya sp. A25]|nr:unnamed protein product [Amoebophrya sp. A25]|eukprot:GSA25T00014191001.1